MIVDKISFNEIFKYSNNAKLFKISSFEMRN